VRAVLRIDEALVEYLVLPERTLAFVLTSDTVRVVALAAGAAALHARVRAARDFLRRASGSEGALPALEALHAALIAPLRAAGALRGARHLVVVPHGPLVQLPFAALRDAATGRFLLEDLVIRYASSAAALAHVEERARQTVLPERVAVFAPFPDRLPGTAAEAEAIRGGWQVDRVMGSRATERRVRSALGRAQLVHLATHTVLEPTDPLRSRLELAPDRSHGSDGRLEVREIVATPIAAPWVFLSGCETAVAGAWQAAFGRGDDLSTLADAFIWAGALGVVGTLWRVPDRGSAALAGRFYAHLAAAGPAEALARAQRDLLATAEFSAPYHWAGHLLTGARGAGGQFASNNSP
jgi:CHAT domain-containing protein